MRDGGRLGLRRHALCRLADLPEDGARGFAFTVGGERCAVIVLRRAGRVFGYVNSCPHRGTPLDWAPDRFLDPTGSFLICATHGARFRVEDGFCVSGPCAGDGLKPARLEVSAGKVFIALPAPTSGADPS